MTRKTWLPTCISHTNGKRFRVKQQRRQHPDGCRRLRVDDLSSGGGRSVRRSLQATYALKTYKHAIDNTTSQTGSAFTLSVLRELESDTLIRWLAILCMVLR